MTKDIVIELQHLGDSTPHNQGRSTIYSAISEIERLRELAYLLIDELRFNGGYEAYTPKMLFDEFYEQAVRGE